MKKLAAIFGVMALSVSSGVARADGIGLPVFGTLTLPTFGTTNFFDSANGAVPPGYGNSNTNGNVIIGPGIEFGATNGEDLLTADFTGTTVTITDTCVSKGCGTTPFTIAFYSPFITGYTVSSINFPNISVGFGFDPAFGGNAGTLTFAGSPNFAGGTATFDYTSIPQTTPIPEPGTLGLVATGLVGAFGAMRRKIKV